jgi:hypothetical protein
VLCLHRNVCQVRSLVVPIVAKRSDLDWVSSNTVLSTWGAWSSALSAQKCLSGEKLNFPDCGKTFQSDLGFQQHGSVHSGGIVQCCVCTECVKSLTVRIVANYADLGRAAIIMDLE